MRGRPAGRAAGCWRRAPRSHRCRQARTRCRPRRSRSADSRRCRAPCRGSAPRRASRTPSASRCRRWRRLNSSTASPPCAAAPILPRKALMGSRLWIVTLLAIVMESLRSRSRRKGTIIASRLTLSRKGSSRYLCADPVITRVVEPLGLGQLVARVVLPAPDIPSRVIALCSQRRNSSGVMCMGGGGRTGANSKIRLYSRTGRNGEARSEEDETPSGALASIAPTLPGASRGGDRPDSGYPKPPWRSGHAQALAENVPARHRDRVRGLARADAPGPRGPRRHQPRHRPAGLPHAGARGGGGGPGASRRPSRLHAGAGDPGAARGGRRRPRRRRAVEVDPGRIVVVPGGKVTMFFAITMFGEPGAEILYPIPVFPSTNR